MNKFKIVIRVIKPSRATKAGHAAGMGEKFWWGNLRKETIRI
jgi:hypothetical protein